MSRRLVLLLTVFAMIVAACSEPEPETGETPPTTAAPDISTPSGTGAAATTTPGAGGDGTSVVERHAGEEWFLGSIPDLPVAADDSLESIRIGMINQEDTPFGSFPELRFAADAAVNWINAELGGVGGRPIELIPCATTFSIESSRACAQDLVLDEVVAVVGGIDVLIEGGLPVLEQNGIPLVGGIPAGIAEQRSPLAFAFSGGTAGGMAAFMQHAADQGYERAFIAYGEFPSFQVAAEDYGARVGRELGLDVRLHAFPLTLTDYTRVLNDAKSFGAQAVVINAADAACVPVMELFNELEFDGTLYLFGACAAESIINAADGANRGVVFSAEGPPADGNIEGTIYNVVSTEYNEGNAQAAGTVGFRGMMNLYAILLELGPDNITSQGIIDTLRAAVDHDSFWGHDYTCDGQQVPGLQSLCAPQQTLFTIDGDYEITFISDWIDTVDLFARAFAE